MTGKAKFFFENETFRPTLHQSSGRIFKKASLHATRASQHSQMLMFCTLGDYMIGLPLYGNVNPNGEFMANSYPSKMSKHALSAKHKDLRLQIEKNASSEQHREHPFKDIKAFMLKHYAEREIVFLRYGQKLELNSHLESFLEEIRSTVGIVLDIGIALEFCKEGSFMAAKLSSFEGSRTWNYLNSSNAGNVKVFNPEKHVACAYLETIYNTIIILPM